MVLAATRWCCNEFSGSGIKDDNKNRFILSSWPKSSEHFLEEFMIPVGSGDESRAPEQLVYFLDTSSSTQERKVWLRRIT